MMEVEWTSQRALVLLTSAAALLAVWIPLWRGLRMCFAARRATRFVPRATLERGADRDSKGGVEPLSLLMARVLVKSLRAEGAERNPSEFVLDATKQYVQNEYDANYARVISMYANLLPPVGLTGNAIGMMVLLVSKHVSDAPLELAALGLALLSTIFALLGYALLEALKLRLYGRLLKSLDEVVSMHRQAERHRERAAAGRPSPSPQTA
jgi:hypothetical protein